MTDAINQMAIDRANGVPVALNLDSYTPEQIAYDQAIAADEEPLDLED